MFLKLKNLTIFKYYKGNKAIKYEQLQLKLFFINQDKIKKWELLMPVQKKNQ